MEAVHRSSYRSWIDSNVVDVRQFLCEYHDAIKHKISSDQNNLFLKNIVSTSEYSEIERQCGRESMQCDLQERVETASGINLPSHIMSSLDTLRLQEEELKKRESTRYASAVYNNQKYYNFPRHKILGTKEDEVENDSPHEPIKTPEVLLSVQIFMPERKQEQNSTIGRSKVPSFQIDQEFLVLGSQYLTELRDKIECLSDRVIPGDFSDYPTTEQHTTCKELYKSGFFYINGTFYNDMRDNDCSDYSEVIIEWAGKEKRGIGPFKKASMEETKFIDLKIQFGYPYVYLHQGECEHLLVFTELRMFTKHDINNRNAYPLYVYVKPMKRFICMICRFYASKWVVYDNKRLPENPFFFCKDCYLSFNYDKNNQKIGSFRAYHYPDEAKIM